MTESSRRAVLLARPGAACERLRLAMADSGAQLVLEADPTLLELPALSAVAPQVVVVALDPATEDAIERFDPVLADPSVEVIYEEAALAAAREGWDLQRWTRHLAAKLHGHGDVLPPGHEPEGEPVEPVLAPAPSATVPMPVAPPAPTALGADVEDTLEVVAIEAPIEATSEMPLEMSLEAPLEMQVDMQVETVAAPATPAAVLDPEPTPAGEAVPIYNAFDPVAAELSFDSAGPMEFSIETIELHDTPVVIDDGAAVLADVSDDDTLTLSPFESSFDYEVEAPVEAAPRDAAQVAEPVLLFEASRPTANESSDAGTTTNAKADAPAAPDWSFAEHNEVAPGAPRDTASDHRFQRDLGDLDRRISSLELVEDRPAVHHDGAVLVMAGIGGPDAVRQLLGALPEGFPRPVLVQQRLDGGRFDRLVAQMQRATPLQVRLAEPGLFAMAGVIYILPAVIGLSVNESGIRFTDEDGDVLAALPSADSAVLLLSGADASRVDAAMNHSWAGALVAGQAPDGCYDAAAAAALIARGAASGQPAELAARLAARWR